MQDFLELAGVPGVGTAAIWMLDHASGSLIERVGTGAIGSIRNSIRVRNNQFLERALRDAFQDALTAAKRDAPASEHAK